MDRRFRGWAEGKGKARPPKREKAKLGGAKGKRENTGNHFCDPIKLGEPDHANARTNETERNDCRIEHPLTTDYAILWPYFPPYFRSRNQGAQMQPSPKSEHSLTDLSACL